MALNEHNDEVQTVQFGYNAHSGRLGVPLSYHGSMFMMYSEK